MTIINLMPGEFVSLAGDGGELSLSIGTNGITVRCTSALIPARPIQPAEAQRIISAVKAERAMPNGAPMGKAWVGITPVRTARAATTVSADETAVTKPKWVETPLQVARRELASRKAYTAYRQARIDAGNLQPGVVRRYREEIAANRVHLQKAEREVARLVKEANETSETIKTSY